MRAFFLGVIVLAVLEALGGWLAVQNGWINPRADQPAPPLEKWASRIVIRAIRHDSQGLTSPIAPTDDNLIAGIKIYGQKCAICHGASDAKGSDIAKGLYIRPPLLAKDGVEDDPVGETYYKVEHGMRLTPMPAFANTLTDQQAWQVALFLKSMDKLPAAADAEWKRIPSQATSIAPPEGAPPPLTQPPPAGTRT